MNGRLRAAVTDWPTSNQRLKSLLSVSASAIGRLGDLGDKDEPGRSGDRLLSWGEQRAWAIYSNGRGQRSRDRETKGGRTGAMGDWAKGEGDSTLLASASAHLPGAGKGPLSAFRLRATRLHGRAERVCAPWANSGASLATLPGYVSGFQSAASFHFISRGRLPT